MPENEPTQLSFKTKNKFWQVWFTQLQQAIFINNQSNEIWRRTYFINFDFDIKNNLILNLPEICNELETKLKAYIQEYNYRMLNNKLELDA